MILGLWSLVATAAALPPPQAPPPPDPSALPSTALPWDLAPVAVLPEDLLRLADEQGSAPLAWRDLAEGLVLAFRVRPTDERPGRWLTAAELATVGLEAAELEPALRIVLPLHPDRPERTQVTDMDAWYWVSAEGDGLDHVGWLHPAALDARCGDAGLRLASPTRGTLLAWCGGSEPLDRVMAVGVARILEAAEAPVSARVYTWDRDAGALVVWGQAVH
ncbi:MAG: hypothetical protein H6742_07465 [Alphaproteobacteria bacterium]|nr:hypothetical protein [Alphaproteobacteria bacterium]